MQRFVFGSAICEQAEKLGHRFRDGAIARWPNAREISSAALSIEVSTQTGVAQCSGGVCPTLSQKRSEMQVAPATISQETNIERSFENQTGSCPKLSLVTNFGGYSWSAGRNIAARTPKTKDMVRTKIAGIGFYVPEQTVTNFDLMRHMDTSDEWIQERSGIQERHYAKRFEETTTTLGAKAAEIAIQRAGISKEDVDFIIFATLSPDYFFPGCGVLLQRELGIAKTEIGALDIRNQCSGFVYGLTVADQFIKTGMYKNILLVGAEVHSMGLDYTTRGRNVTVLFGDGAGAVVLQPTAKENQGILTSKLHADGTHAEQLAFINPGCHAGYHFKKMGMEIDLGYGDVEFGGLFLTQKMIDDAMIYPVMDGQLVFKTAVVKFPEVILEALSDQGLQPTDIDLFVPHQANLRISQFVQKRLGLRDDQVWNNIQRYGNTTAATIPIALCEAWEAGKVKEGDLVCIAAFGSGFTWGASLLRW
jgi:3-oxoacyl-[acyl-carrier-protein] synthase-3